MAIKRGKDEKTLQKLPSILIEFVQEIKRATISIVPLKIMRLRPLNDRLI